MDEAQRNPLAFDFKDRSTGLKIFGILTMLMGGLCALFVPLMIFGQAMTPKTAGVTANYNAIIPGIVLYGLLAVALIWLGIGSFNARRWARALLLIFSWSWLLVGVIALVAIVFVMPQSMLAMQQAGQPPLSETARSMILTITLLITGVIFLIMPGIWVFFYRSRHVKATCESLDPLRRWTDACPLPVLAISLWMAWTAPMMLLMPLTQNGVLPFFGIFLTGLPGSLGCIVLAGVWAWCALAMYRLDVRGWWLLVVSFSVFTVSHVITYSLHDVMELYVLMGYPEQQIEQLKKFNFLTRDMMVLGALAFTLPFFGYLIYVKKFFRKE